MGNLCAIVFIGLLAVLFIGQVLMMVGKRGEERRMIALAREAEEAEPKKIE